MASTVVAAPDKFRGTATAAQVAAAVGPRRRAGRMDLRPGAGGRRRRGHARGPRRDGPPHHRHRTPGRPGHGRVADAGGRHGGGRDGPGLGARPGRRAGGQRPAAGVDPGHRRADRGRPRRRRHPGHRRRGRVGHHRRRPGRPHRPQPQAPAAGGGRGGRGLRRHHPLRRRGRGLRAPEGRHPGPGRPAPPPPRTAGRGLRPRLRRRRPRACRARGAAGGLAGGLAAAGAVLVPGFDLVAEALDLAERIATADLVVTGEGHLDAESFAGKAVGGVIGLAAAAGVPVLVVAGGCRGGRGPVRPPRRPSPSCPSSSASAWRTPPGTPSAASTRWSAGRWRRSAGPLPGRPIPSGDVLRHLDDGRALGHVGRVPPGRSSTPARSSATRSTAVAWAPSSSSGRLRWVRTPRSTWAMLPSPKRAATSTSRPRSTP